jgi:putative endonuclease
MPSARKELGQRGELAALNYLAARGYRLVEKNHRRRGGEIDLVLRDGEVLVFCEVKTSRWGFAWESYGVKQRRRMIALVRAYLARERWQGPVRVDLLALDRQPDSPHYRVEHFQDVLSVDEA